MPEPTQDPDVSQVLASIRQLIDQSRSPSRPPPFRLTPELRVGGASGPNPAPRRPAVAAVPDGPPPPPAGPSVSALSDGQDPGATHDPLGRSQPPQAPKAQAGGADILVLERPCAPRPRPFAPSMTPGTAMQLRASSAPEADGTTPGPGLLVLENPQRLDRLVLVNPVPRDPQPSAPNASGPFPLRNGAASSEPEAGSSPPETDEASRLPIGHQASGLADGPSPGEPQGLSSVPAEHSDPARPAQEVAAPPVAALPHDPAMSARDEVDHAAGPDEARAPGLRDSAEEQSDTKDIQAPADFGIPDLSAFLPLAGLPTSLALLGAEEGRPAASSGAAADGPPRDTGSRADRPELALAGTEEPVPWIEPDWPELRTRPDPAALAEDDLAALLPKDVAEDPDGVAMPPADPEDSLRDRVAVLVRETLQQELGDLREVVRREIREALADCDR